MNIDRRTFFGFLGTALGTGYLAGWSATPVIEMSASPLCAAPPASFPPPDPYPDLIAFTHVRHDGETAVSYVKCRASDDGCTVTLMEPLDPMMIARAEHISLFQMARDSFPYHARHLNPHAAVWTLDGPGPRTSRLYFSGPRYKRFDAADPEWSDPDEPEFVAVFRHGHVPRGADIYPRRGGGLLIRGLRA